MNIILSISVVVFLHYAWYYLKDNYSTKKKKDLVEYQSQKYKQIIQEIQKQKEERNLPKNNFISAEEKQMMIDELKTLLIEGEEPISYEIHSSVTHTHAPTNALLLMPPPPTYLDNSNKITADNTNTESAVISETKYDKTIHISLQPNGGEQMDVSPI